MNFGFRRFFFEEARPQSHRHSEKRKTRAKSNMHGIDGTRTALRLCRSGTESLKLAHWSSVEISLKFPRAWSVNIGSLGNFYKFLLKWVRALFKRYSAIKPKSFWAKFSRAEQSSAHRFKGWANAMRDFRVRFEPKIFWREIFLEGRSSTKD